MKQSEIIGVFVTYILSQSQKQFDFELKDVTEAIINNGYLYISLSSMRTEVIALS